MNMNSIYTMTKYEIFDLVYDTEFEADYAVSDEKERRYMHQLSVLRSILRSMGWMEEYRQWVENGAGSVELEAEIRKMNA